MIPQDLFLSVEAELSKYYIGSKRTTEQLLVALLAQAHVLIEDIPGVGKTTLVKCLAALTGLSCKRIQFSPDLLPGDIVGAGIWNPSTTSFEYRSGPINAQCVLADELNRGSTRTQAAFLEAMQEGQVTVDGVSYPLPRPFWVIATQNPLDYSSTFPLPDAELDRFGISIRLGYPSHSEESRILDLHQGRVLGANDAQLPEAIFSPEEVVEHQKAVAKVRVSQKIKDYAIFLAARTRREPSLTHGISPRATVQLLRLAQARAYLQGRDAVLAEDLAEYWIACAEHRLSLSGESRLGGKTKTEVLETILDLEAKPAP